MRPSSHQTNAFSLVELAIVLVILGLLAGGVLSGTSLIRAAELRGVTEEYSRYTSSMLTFRDKYFALPGDMPNATQFWGKDDTNCTGDTGTAATPGTCNGNGDGIMNYAAAGGDKTGEIYRFWQHLARAGLIEGTYSGQSSSGGIGVLGVNEPKSRLSNAGWSLGYLASPFTGSADTYAGNYGNVYRFGSQNTTSSGADGPILKAEEVWNIDTKMDDGKPAYGNLVLTYWSPCSDSGTSDPAANATNNYKLTATGKDCSFYIRNIF